MTDSTGMSAYQAIKNSQDAMRRAEKLAARHWAALAATLAPELEEPWLLMAALATPLASVGYLKQALKLKPESPRAQAGMRWALKRVEPLQIPNAAADESELADTVPVARAALVAAKGNAEEPALADTVPTARKPLIAATIAPEPALADTAPVQASQKPQKEKKNSSLFILLTALVVVCLALVVLKPTSGLAIFRNLAAAPVQFTETATPTPVSQAQVEALPLPAIPTSTPEIVLPPTASPTPEASPTAEIEDTPTALPTDTGPSSSTGYQDQASLPPYTGTKRVEVSISQQHMYAYDGDTLVFSFVISTGMNGATRVGNFAVLDKIPNAYGSTWDLWMPNWLGIYYSGNLENGIHALPILHNGVTLWAGYLGTPISYGCVVLSTYESQLLYDWVDIGTPVIITY